jgi:hypothetical protein
VTEITTSKLKGGRWSMARGFSTTEGTAPEGGSPCSANGPRNGASLPVVVSPQFDRLRCAIWAAILSMISGSS